MWGNLEPSSGEAGSSTTDEQLQATNTIPIWRYDNNRKESITAYLHLTNTYDY